MAMTKNSEYQGQDYPYDGVLFPPELNEHHRIKTLPAAADAATSIMYGALAYFSQGTQKNDITPCGALYGKDDREGAIYQVIPRKGDIRFAYTTDAPWLPGLIPNSSITLSDYQLAAEAECEVVKLVKGMYVWALIGNDITGDVVWNYIYYCAANGLVGAGGDPDGTGIDRKAHAFRAVASFENLNWALFEYLGSQAFDNST